MIKKDLALFIAFVLISLLHLNSGDSGLGIFELASMTNSNSLSELFNLRLYRYLSASLVGGSLALCGLYFQSYLKNPLAEPFTMGFSGAAALGISLGIFIGLQNPFLIASLGFIFCLACVALVLFIQKRLFRKNPVDLILIGICIGFFCNAVVIILQSLFKPDDLQMSYQWLIGSLEHFRTSNWWLALLPLAALACTQVRFGKQLDRLHLGEKMALSMGTPLSQIQRSILLAGALACGVSVYLCGVIAFLGFIAPHLTKSFFGTSLHGKLFLRCFVVGALLLILSDSLAIRLASESSIPTGGIISLLGVPFFFKILLGGKVHGNN